MPSGKMHDNITFLSIIPVFLTGSYVLKLGPEQVYALTFAAVFSQLMFGPDLDVQSKQYKRWGIFRWIWIPYMKLFAHRSRFTHGLVFGPIFRFVYLLFALTLLFLLTLSLIDYLFSSNFLFSLSPQIVQAIVNTDLSGFIPFTFPLFAGIFIGAAIHTITDKIFSFFKNLV
ncbi:MAG: hypothetical protein ACD_20C00402G0016 [uncultured bacterium]|nr:MAG: hypothetical protein ACD_20C00402G0016 [uncultured bacterium]HBH18237.1 hypothetical protein [Cyanobacteria bacterium UBA9579]